MTITMKITYQVYCRSSRRYGRWIPYSKEYDTRDEAEKCKSWAEGKQVLDLYNNLIIYEIREKHTPA